MDKVLPIKDKKSAVLKHQPSKEEIKASLNLLNRTIKRSDQCNQMEPTEIQNDSREVSSSNDNCSVCSEIKSPTVESIPWSNENLSEGIFDFK